MVLYNFKPVTMMPFGVSTCIAWTYAWLPSNFLLLGQEESLIIMITTNMLQHDTVMGFSKQAQNEWNCNLDPPAHLFASWILFLYIAIIAEFSSHYGHLYHKMIMIIIITITITFVKVGLTRWLLCRIGSEMALEVADIWVLDDRLLIFGRRTASRRSMHLCQDSWRGWAIVADQTCEFEDSAWWICNI